MLIYYDDSMESYINELADFLIELTNDALGNSEVDMRFSAGLVPIQLTHGLKFRRTKCHGCG